MALMTAMSLSSLTLKYLPVSVRVWNALACPASSLQLVHSSRHCQGGAAACRPRRLPLKRHELDWTHTRSKHSPILQITAPRIFPREAKEKITDVLLSKVPDTPA